MKVCRKLRNLLCIAICLILLMPNLVFGSMITDINGHWAEAQIIKWVDKGYIKGNGDGTFKPDKPITRAEFITVVNKAFGFTDKAYVLDFKDIKKTDWYYDDVAKAVNAGYINGCGNNMMMPGGNITNQETAAVISRLLKLAAPQDYDLSARFKDSESIPEWCRDAVKAVASMGYMKGYNDRTFKPAKPITRAEVVAVLDSCYLKHQKKAFCKAGIYSEGTVEGSVLIGTRDVTLKDTVINGDLILGEDIGDGDIHLKNVFVKGETIIKGGGMNSIYIEDSSLAHIIIIKVDNKVRVVAVGNTRIDTVDMQSGAKLEEQGVTGTGFSYVTIAEESAENASIILTGNFDSVQLMADKVDLSLIGGSIENLNITGQGGASNINIAAGSTVSNMALNAQVYVTGSGRIQNAQVNAAGSTLGITPENIVNPVGLNVTISSPTTPAAPPASSGGGSGSGSGGNSGSGNNQINDVIPPELYTTPIQLSSNSLSMVFNEKLNRASAETAGNYELNNGIGKASKAKLGEDGMTVTVDFPYHMSKNKVYKLSINNVKDLSGNSCSGIIRSFVAKKEISPEYIPPELVSVAVIDNKTLELTFSEQIDKNSAEILTNYYVNYGIGNPLAAVLKDDGRTVRLTFPQLESGKQYIIYVNYIADLDGNKMVNGKGYFFISLEHDITVPEVVAAKAPFSNELRITFDETVEVKPGARIVVSFGNTPEYADFIWTGTAALGSERTVVFKANKYKASGDSLAQSGSFTGTNFLMESTCYSIVKVTGITDFAGNVYDVDNDNNPVFTGSSLQNDRPEVVSIEQTDAVTIRLVFSEPVLSPECTIFSKDALNKKFMISKTDPDEEKTDSGYSTIDLTADSLLGKNTYSFDLSASGLRDFCGTPVKDAGDSDGNDSGCTDFTATYEDTAGPYIEDVEAINDKTIYVMYDEPLSYPGTYQIMYEQSDFERTINNSAVLCQDNNRIVKISATDRLSTDETYILRPTEAAMDLSGNLSGNVDEEWQFQGSDVEAEYIESIKVLNGKEIEIYLSTYTGGTDSISVVDKVYSGIELCEQLTVEDSIGFSAPTDIVTVTTKKPLMDGRDYIVTIGGASVGSADLSKAVSYEFIGIVDDNIEIDGNGIITFDGADASCRAVYLVFGDVRYLIVPDNPLTDFDAAAILDLIGSDSNYRIEVYGLEKQQDVTEDGNWVGEYGEYSETNPNGFKLGPILYAREF